MEYQTCSDDDLLLVIDMLNSTYVLSKFDLKLDINFYPSAINPHGVMPLYNNELTTNYTSLLVFVLHITVLHI